jgi:hypothetical protein
LSFLEKRAFSQVRQNLDAQDEQEQDSEEPPDATASPSEGVFHVLWSTFHPIQELIRLNIEDPGF